MGFIPDSMLNQANERVDKAMETGGRSSTTIHTDYGVIGDAFFKKAQIDMQIADLKANMGMRKAEMMSNLEIKKAELDLNARQLQIDTGFKAAELKALAADRKVGFMEQLTGSLGGAASGAMAGYSATGNPKGAMIGAAIGGGMTMMNYQQGGRRGGENAQKTLGHIADLSVQYKGMKDEQTQKDAWAGVLQTGKTIMDEMNSAKTPQQRMSAMEKMEGYLGQVYATGMSMPNANPEKVGSMVSSMRTAMTSQAGFSDDPETAGRQMKQLRTLVKYQGDERQNDPKSQRAWANDYMRETNADYEDTYGKTMPLNMQRQAAYDLSPAVGEAFDKKIDSGAGSFGSIPTHARGTTTTQSSDGEEGRRNVNMGNADGERVTSFHPNESGMPVETRPFGQAGPGAIPFRDSVSMDDGGDFKPVKSEMELTDQAGETVQAMDDITKGRMNDVTDEEADDFDRDQSIFEKDQPNRPGLKERMVRGFQQGVPFADKIPLLAEGSTLDKMADEAENERLGRPVEFSKTDSVARRKAYEKNNIKDAESWNSEVRTILDEAHPDKAPDVRAKNAVRDAAYEVVRQEKILADLPKGYLGELKARAHAEGIGVEELATASLIVAGGAGGKALGAGAKGVASKSVIFKRGNELFARIPKVGVVKVTEKTLTAIGIVSGGAAAKLANVAGLDQVDPNIRALTKGKKIGLSDKEAAAVDEYHQSVRDLAFANIMASTGKEPRQAELEAEIKSLMSLSDNPQTRWNKLSDLMAGLKDTAEGMRTDFGGGGGSGGGGSKKSSSSVPRPGSAAWRAEKEAEWEWQQEKEKRKGRSGKNGSFVPMNFFGPEE